MIMVWLTARSLRRRAGAFTASFVTLFVGAVVVMTFASLLDAAVAAGVDPESRSSLVIMAVVVGGWGLVLVALVAVSTLSLLARQRDREMALLKSLGATPAQLARLVVGEAVAVAVAAAMLAVAPAVPASAGLMRLLTDSGQVASTVSARFGPIAVVTGLGVTVIAAAAAAAVSARRVTTVAAGDAIRAAAVQESRMRPLRVVAGVLLITTGTGCAVTTVLLPEDTGMELMAVAVQASIQVSAGFAVLAPALIRTTVSVLKPALRHVTGRLAVAHGRRRVHQLAGPLMPIVLFTGIAVATLYAQDIENATVTRLPVATLVETLNFVVIGMIAGFTAISLVNTLIAAISHRRGEFGLHRLAGSTPGQVLAMVGTEALILLLPGVVFGTLAGLATVIPYSIARTGSPIPDSPATLYLGVVATTVVLTFAASVGSAHRAIQTPAVRAVAL